MLVNIHDGWGSCWLPVDPSITKEKLHFFLFILNFHSGASKLFWFIAQRIVFCCFFNNNLLPILATMTHWQFVFPCVSLVGVGGVTSSLTAASSVPWRRRTWRRSAGLSWPTVCCITVATRTSRASSGTWSLQVKMAPPGRWRITLVRCAILPVSTCSAGFLLDLNSKEKHFYSNQFFEREMSRTSSIKLKLQHWR